jgi:DinB family
MPALEDLSADIRTSDREYVDYVSALDRDQLADLIDFAFTDGAPGRMSREQMLMHVITHGVGHRGHLSAVMLLNSVTPAKDGFTTYLHNAEAFSCRAPRAPGASADSAPEWVQPLRRDLPDTGRNLANAAQKYAIKCSICYKILCKFSRLAPHLRETNHNSPKLHCAVHDIYSISAVIGYHRRLNILNVE